MVTFTIVLIALAVIAIAAIIATIVGGAGLIVMFGDVIVFGLILWAIIRLIRRRR